MGVTLRVLALLSVAAAAGAEGGRAARSPDPQVPGAFVPRPVHIYGPDGGRQVEPHREVLFSYRINPFETEVYQRGQAPVRYPQSSANQRHTGSYSQQQPQFFHSPGQQPLVYHPNFIPQPQYQPLSNNYLGQFYQSNEPSSNRAHQTFPEVQPQNYFADHRSAPEFHSAPNHYGHHQQPGAPDSFFRSSDQDSGFDRGHVESHPLETQVQTFSNFRQAAYPDDSDSSPFSRAAVEAVPITAQVYTGLQVENSSPSGKQRNIDDDSGAFSRGDVESYPAVLMPYTADRDSYEEQVRTEGDGYGSYGQAGFRQAVESPPIFTPLTDPSEAFPMPVHSNSRPWGHLSEKVLYDDTRAIGHSIPTPDVYSFYNPRMDSVRISEGYKVVCYYESWAIYRPQPLDFTVGDIDPHACTHLIYAFAGLDESNYTIMSLDNDYDIVTGGYKALVGLKAQNPLLKVMIGLGGWNEGGRKYSRMVSSPETRQKFIKSVIKFLDEHHFDGLDFDWEYPGASDRGGRYTDKENFAQLIKELSAEFKMRGWVLSAAVSPARFRVNEGYDVPSLGQYLDFISVITYDLRGPWDGMADHHAPIRTRESDSWAYKSLNALDGLRYWAEKGAPKHKLVLGVPFYARTFTLSDPDSYDPGARATSGGIEGRYTMDRGLYAYYEVCQDQRNGGWLMLRDEVGGPYMVKKDQWIGYDDVDYINLKMDMIRNEGFGGAMVWAIDLDDYLGMCGARWPLLTAVRRRLADGSPPIDDVTFPSEPEPSPEAKPEPDAKPTEGSKPGSEPDSAEKQSESDSQSTSSTSSPPKTDSSEELGSEDADRLIRIGSDQSALHERDFACPAPGIHRLADDCSAYYVCNRRFEATKFVCPISLQFDLSRRICNRPQYVRCGAGFAPVSRRDCAADGLYNNPSDCTMYAWCRGGVATHFTCPLGMHFDYLQGVCAEPGEASCNNHEMVRALFDNTTFSLQRPSFRQTRGPHKVVCFFPNWALNRPDEGMFVPENIDPSLCSHIVYAFATIDASTLLLHPYDMAVDISRKFYERVIALKQRQPSVKVMISVGGWADSASDKYSRLVNNPRARKDFVDFSVRMLKAFGFDGLDLHWLYPTCPQMRCSGGNLSDKQGFSALVTELRSAFNRESPALLLSATVAAARGIISRAYDARTLNANLDFVNVLTFDFHTHREGKTGHVSPLYQRPDDEYESQNSAYALEFWVRLGVSRSKINLGIPFYGQTFQLANPGQSSLYAPVIGPGDAGPITLQRGMLSYMEMCQRVRDRGWQIARDPSGAIGPFAHRGDQWVSYDDPISVSFKANYVKSEGFGGVMAWSIDFDDFSNKCCREPMPLLRTLARELLDIPLPPPRPGGDCTAPPRPVTPPPPVTTTTYSSGKLTRPTPIDWLPGDDGGKPAGTRPTSRPPTTVWTTSSTTPRTSTWWWTPPSQATTTTTRRTTTTTSTTTPRTTTTTPRTTTTTPRTTTWWWKPPTSTTRRTTTRRTTTRRTTTVRTTTRRTTTRRPRPTTTPASRPPSGAGPSEGDACDSEEYHPVSGTCNKFLRCIQGSLKSFKCAPRLHWNQKNKLCDWPATAGCSSASTVKVERTTTSTTTSRPQPPPWFTTTRRSTSQTRRTTQPPIRTTTWWWRPPVTTTRRPAITTTARPIVTTTRRPPASPGASQFGPCEAGTKRPHPTDCGLFLDCTSAREWTERRCAPGLEWDRQQNLCNWPQLAGCSVGQAATKASSRTLNALKVYLL